MQEEETIDDAIHSMIEGQNYIQRKERRLRLLENAFDTGGLPVRIHFYFYP